MKFKRRLIDSFLDKESEFKWYCHCFSINHWEFKDDYRSVFNTDFFPKLLNIAYHFSQHSNAWDQKTIILEDDDQRLVLNFREFCDFMGEDELVEEDKEKVEKRRLAYVTMWDRISIDVISDWDEDKDVFFYQMPRYAFCKNILDIIERDLDEYNENIWMPDWHFRTKKEEIKTMTKDYFLKKKKTIMRNINYELSDSIEEALECDGSDDYWITQEEAEKLRKEYGLE